MSSTASAEAKGKGLKDKGKGKLVDAAPRIDEEESEDDEEFVEGQDSEASELASEDAQADGNSEDGSDAENEPATKRAKTSADVGPSSSKKSTGKDEKKGSDDDDEEEVSEPEIEKNASGDELDTSNIIPGGRRSRRGRAGGGGHANTYTAEQKVDSDEDSW